MGIGVEEIVRTFTTNTGVQQERMLRKGGGKYGEFLTREGVRITKRQQSSVLSQGMKDGGRVLRGAFQRAEVQPSQGGVGFDAFDKSRDSRRAGIDV